MKEFEGKGYGELKPAVAESVISVLKPLQDEFARLSRDKAYIDSIIKENAEKANYFATKLCARFRGKLVSGQDPVRKGKEKLRHMNII